MPGVEGRVIYGSDSGAARVLTTSYAATDSSPPYEKVPAMSQACLLFMTSGTAPTSIEWKLQLSHDAGTWCDELTEEHREIVTMAKLIGLTHAEIGAQLGKSEDACRQLLRRALIKLEIALEKRAGS